MWDFHLAWHFDLIWILRLVDWYYINSFESRNKYYVPYKLSGILKTMTITEVWRNLCINSAAGYLEIPRDWFPLWIYISFPTYISNVKAVCFCELFIYSINLNLFTSFSGTCFPPWPFFFFGRNYNLSVTYTMGRFA